MSVRITGLFSYPIKSGAAVAHTQVDVDGRGLVGDREYMVVDEQGVFLTQREAPLLALVRLASDQVVVPAGRALVVPGRGCTVTVWGYTGPAVDCGDSAAELLSAHLGRACRLVRTPAEHGRRSDDDRSGVGFADGYPLLLISEESLADLNARLPVPLPMDRFRPTSWWRAAPRSPKTAGSRYCWAQFPRRWSNPVCAARSRGWIRRPESVATGNRYVPSARTARPKGA
ncbi:MAG: MOSC N-terminal beta barrel domain-containing protein [Candidatus Nanopelagicales bacterium]